jgi:ABC-2 type transport system ATP-binding protein
VIEPIVKVENLFHTYPDQKSPALQGLSFSVASESIFGIIGPNGGGKSTTFKILSTLIQPQSGTVMVGGIDVLKSPGKIRSLLGVVFQSPALDKKLTVEENIIHQGYLYGMKGQPLVQKAEFLLRRLGLWEKRNEKTENLSGGQKRRLEITKSLIHTPKILILDEPTTGLDPLARREVWNYLNFLREKEKITVLVTTHLLDEAEDCDEIALVDKGKVVSLGEPSQLRSELGGDLVTVKTNQTDTLIKKLLLKFETEVKAFGQELRVQPSNIPGFVEFLVNECSTQFDSFTVGKPTLEDLFIDKTGHKFWEESTVAEGEITQ